MRVIVDPVPGYAHLFQHLRRNLQGFLLTQLLVLNDNLRQLLADCHNRIQGGHRVLKDHGNSVAAHFLIFFVGVINQVSPLEKNLSIQDNPGGIWDQLHHRQRHSGFAGAGFANKAQHFTLFYLEIHSVDRLYVIRVGHIMDVQVFDFQ